MSRGVLIVAVLLILIPGVWLFIATNSSDSDESTINNQPANTHNHQGEEHEDHLANAVDTDSVSIVSSNNDGFSPVIIKVKSGTKVTWTNNDSLPHVMKFTDEASEQLNRGDTFIKTFGSTGTFDYECGIHSNMSGIVIVEE